ncbi:50S ribosomal protein L18 [Candidatus Roizmanbacteria bacterium RIFCSPLOWO2_01_FULL_37_13]|uniref:Large ribosomal subunit protein uL18 n=1 Tax=Candidatus Roizmanbacteria bacterium RIFCSPHIGHO2_02_FULL_38_11 TaxID=1802039 RepID=A0A1F7H2L1_9BACT|nr:MAG: 50S ribosomal protein L18 [Candidatus Roizmanbacteria bacterium RIFCSPHIGHO2_02_FULL_38_11]OGK35437.1 MAG: 50S ribosomal protein L18 [Candidatus Roizmanbacteria bacterium RIFCSPHIGHO2_12_FULL_37_9b]OGK40926.1 MAG: 50S ribosomal protein L18 [Candidatus Roizmanbacteria bacterium RIFCSPLOWO2_01_FULL_37_13]
MGKISKNREIRRKKRISANIFGTREKPRISAFSSNRYIYAQVIDDNNRITIVSYSSLKLAQAKNYNRGKKVEEAKKVGVELAKKAVEKGITQAVFDRGKYSYKGRVKALAEGLREGGLKI